METQLYVTRHATVLYDNTADRRSYHQGKLPSVEWVLVGAGTVVESVESIGRLAGETVEESRSVSQTMEHSTIVFIVNGRLSFTSRVDDLALDWSAFAAHVCAILAQALPCVAFALFVGGCSALADFGGYNFDQNVADGGGIVRGGHHEAPDDAGDADTLTQDAAWKPEQNDSAVIYTDSGSTVPDAHGISDAGDGSPLVDGATDTTSDGSISDVDASSVSTDAGEASPDASRDAGVSSPCGEGYTWCEGSCQLSSPFLHCNF